MPALTLSLTVAGLVALAVAFASPEVAAAAQRDLLTPTACTVAPRTAADIAALAAGATPAPESPDGAAHQSDEGVGIPADLPPGEPADRETIDQITAAARELAGCLNAADGPRLAALMTEDAVTRDGGPGGASLLAAAGTPEPGSGEAPREIAWVRVRDVRELPDGRVGAVVVWAVTNTPQGKPVPETNDHVYERVGDRWLLDVEISGAPDTDAILRRARQGFNEVDSALYAEPTMAGAKFSIEALVMVGFAGNDDYDGVGCEMFIFERGENAATVSAYCRAEEALIGRAAYLDVQVYGPRRGNDSAPSSCEDVAPLAAMLVFSCTVEVPEAAP